MQPDSRKAPALHGRSRRKRRPLGIAVAFLLLLTGGGYAAFRLAGGDSPDEDPQVVSAREPLTAFLAAWAGHDARKAAGYTDTPDGAASLLGSVLTNLKPSRTTVVAGAGQKKNEGEVHFPFTVAMAVPGAGDVTWHSRARMLHTSGKWEVEFTSPMIHPELKPGQTLALKGGNDRAKVLDANGDPLRADSLVGTVDPVSGRGTSGLEARYDDVLSGGKKPNKILVVADRQSGRAVKDLTKAAPAEGRPVRTTIDPRIQQAAAEALTGVEVNAAIVAIDPRNGHILAAANRPGGLNRALEGRYPPGSVFKVITAAALLEGGVRPGDPAACPKFTHVNGQRFENQGQFQLPAGSTFADAFAQSCNTYFVNARSRLSDTDLRDAAQAFGIGGSWDVGTSTYDGSVPVTTSDNDKAAATIGQARVQTSPLVMASVAATVKNARFNQPMLVPDAVKKKYDAPVALDAEVTGRLRELMRATVTSGSARALKDLPGRPHAKTGTAEFGAETPPRTHAWMIGYQGDSDLAWAVLLEDGGSGGADAGPVAARFLRNLAG
ncbi:PbsX family transcriptional regulator [Streptomyces sp. ISL-36]|uniref:penicillin-binding transpeptidase domain-containing protein n=1 Tax=Streptomyces sp. ISL-36 TaxID=2819182 RepID=UPI001BE54A5D|nr:penicillin-binding transpeptidase domain-containing protein [Streptomyces sp. ISL-36]MBT2443960.1 PbsX family transcriptional regulator [Streptomyces sp. ISL-36]